MKLQEARKAAGLSQSQLAEKAGLSVRTLQHYEQGSKIFDHARLDTIIKVCLALNCEIKNVIENEKYIELIDEYQKTLEFL